MVPIWYASFTEVKRAADVPSSALYDALLADAMDEGKDAVIGLCQRSFEPEIKTVTFPWPQDMTQDIRMLRLGKHSLISLITVTDGDGSTLDNANLRLIKEGSATDAPPYSAVMNSNGWTTNGTFPDISVGILGLYGYDLNERSATTTVSMLSGTTVDVSNSSSVDVGALIRIGTERLVVLSKGWLNSGNSAAVTLDAEESSDRFTVTSGAAFNVGESITIESEEMVITKITGNQLVVKRATNGSALSAHTAVTAVYVDRRLSVERAVLGTTATDTAAGAVVLVHKFPGLVRQLHKAETLYLIQQDSAAYGTRSGSGQGEVPMTERAIEALRVRVREAYGYRPVRGAAV
jgi:hypothetical protein